MLDCRQKMCLVCNKTIWHDNELLVHLNDHKKKAIIEKDRQQSNEDLEDRQKMLQTVIFI